MDALPPLTGREPELQIIRNALTAASAGRGSLLLVSGPAGIGKTRVLEEAAAEAADRGFAVGAGVAFAESPVLYHAWQDALRAVALDHLLRDEPPPRLLALYLVSETGLPIVRAERPGFSEDPALLSMMLNNAGEFLRDAIKPGEAEAEGDLMRLAIGGRGVCIARAPRAALLAVFEGRETEIFLREVRLLLDDLTRRAGSRLDGWDGNKRAVADLAGPLSSSMQSGRFDGVDLAWDGQARKFNLFDNVLFGLRRRALDAPLLVVLDDLQWADASSLGLLHYLARNTRDAPVLFVGAFRAEERESRPQLREALAALARDDLADELALGRLSAAETKSMAERFLGPHAVADTFFDRLAADADGNPLIVREVLRQMRESGALAPDPSDGLLRTTGGSERLLVPRKIREAVALRLAGVERADRELLDAAAVCGTRFPGKLVALVGGASELQVARQLGSIERHHGVIRAAGGAWRFEHPVIREVVYDSIAPDLRRLLHLEAAQALPGVGGSPVEVGEHFAEAGDPRAVPLLSASVETALELGAADEAARLLAKAVRVAPEPMRARLELQRASALERADHFEDALAAVERARALGADGFACAALRAATLVNLSRLDEAVGTIDAALPSFSAGEAGRLLSHRARAQNMLARFGEAEDSARRALGACPESDLAGRSEALYALAGSEWYRGNYDRAVEVFNASLIMRESLGDKRGISEVFVALGAVMGDQGRLARSVELLTLALSLSEKIGDRRTAAGCHLNIAHTLADLGDLEAAQQAVERAAAAGQKIGNARLLAWSECVMGIILWRRGKARDAVSRFERCARKARELGERRLLATALAESVGPRVALGDGALALADATQAAELARQIGARPLEGLVLRALGEAQAVEGDLEGATGHFKASAAAFASIDNGAGAAETHARWGDAMLRAGERLEAKAHFSRAVELFESAAVKRRAASARTSLVALAQ